MNIAERLRAMREERELSQGDIERRTGLLRCYVSRVENGHTIPAVETLEKFARALGMPLYHLMYDGNEPPKAATVSKTRALDGLWGNSGKDARVLRKLSVSLSHMSGQDRELILGMAHRMAQAARRHAPK
jgi:transcriptional regulator with XRE-family HTH domain